MTPKFIIVASRAGAGKTDLIMQYCNGHPQTTLLLSEQYTKGDIRRKGLNFDVEVFTQAEIENIDWENFETVCIDFIELFTDEFLFDFLKLCGKYLKRVIALVELGDDLTLINQVLIQYFQSQHQQNNEPIVAYKTSTDSFLEKLKKL